MTAYKYKGFDWTELAVGFKLYKAKDIKAECVDNEDKIAKRIREFINDRLNAMMISPDKQKAKIKAKAAADSVRKFLKTMAKCGCGGEDDMWLGLSKCKDDVVLKYTHILLEQMWT